MKATQITEAQNETIKKVECGKFCADFTDGGRVFGYNDELCAMTGYCDEQFDCKEVTFFDLIPEQEFDEYMKQVRMLQKNGGGTLEHRILCADGSTIDVLCTGMDFVNDDGHLCTTINLSNISDHIMFRRKYIRSEYEIQTLIDNMPGAIAVYKIENGKAILHKASSAFKVLADFSGGNIDALKDMMDESDFKLLRKNTNDCINSEQSFEQELTLKNTDGKKKSIRLRGRYYDSSADGLPMIYASIIDITEEKKAERKIMNQSICLKMMAENTDEMFFEYDAEADETAVTVKHSKFGSGDVILKNFVAEKPTEKYVHPDDRDIYRNTWETALSSSGKGTADFRTLAYDDRYRWYRISYVSLADDDDNVVGIYGMVRCIDHMRTMKSRLVSDRNEIRRLSTTDPITGLYNRNAFQAKASHILQEVFNEDECFAIAYSDINDFSYVNENFGYEAGDLMLRDFADEVRDCGISILGCRIYSDFFVSLNRAPSREALIAEIAARNEAFKERQKKKYPMSDIQLSCGIYFLRSADEDINTAIDNANLARRSIKGSTDIPSGVYSERMRTKRSHDQAIASEIWNAINSGAIELFLQPKFDLKTREIIGAEALTRWRNPDGTYKLPYEFIEVLENVGYITQLDLFIYEQVLKSLASWKERGLKLLPISVNFSRKHNNHANFVNKVTALADFYNVDKSLIEIEVTESCFTKDVKNLFVNMRKLRESGFKIDIDDFGMGYSSLSVLMDAPVDIVKVDKVFIDEIGTSERSREYINRICNLIQSTDKEIIFEGVETEQQAQILSESGHRMAQGWLFEKAIPVAEFEKKYLM